MDTNSVGLHDARGACPCLPTQPGPVSSLSHTSLSHPSRCRHAPLVHACSNWVKAGLFDRLKSLAAGRKLSDLSVGPVLSWTTDAMLGHMRELLAIPGARLLFGGKPLTGHTIPGVYGAIEPTAVFVPLEQALKPEHFGKVTTEVFGPFQVRRGASERARVHACAARMRWACSARP